MAGGDGIGTNGSPSSSSGSGKPLSFTMPFTGSSGFSALKSFLMPSSSSSSASTSSSTTSASVTSTVAATTTTPATSTTSSSSLTNPSSPPPSLPPITTQSINLLAGHTSSLSSLSHPSNLISSSISTSNTPHSNDILSIQCIRLQKPSITFEKNLDLSPGMPAIHDHNIKSDFLHSGSLKLPFDDFGPVYLGESLSCFICIRNIKSTIFNSITVNIDLQTTHQRVSLVKGQIFNELKPNELVTIDIRTDIRDLGNHILAVHASYQQDINASDLKDNVSDKEKKSLMKMNPLPFASKIGGDGSSSSTSAGTSSNRCVKVFKFLVENPLSVKTKVSLLAPKIHLVSINDPLDSSCFNHFPIEKEELISFDVQLTNLTNSFMKLESVKFEPFSSFTCVPFSSSSNATYSSDKPEVEDDGRRTGNDNSQNFTVISSSTIPLSSLIDPDALLALDFSSNDQNQQSLNLFCSKDIRQYSFILHPSDYSFIKSSRLASELGKLEVIWNSPLNGYGRLQTSPLLRKIPIQKSLLAVQACMSNYMPLKVEESFLLYLKVFLLEDDDSRKEAITISMRSTDDTNRSFGPVCDAFLLTVLDDSSKDLLILGEYPKLLSGLSSNNPEIVQLECFPLSSGQHRLSICINPVSSVNLSKYQEPSAPIMKTGAQSNLSSYSDLSFSKSDCIGTTATAMRGDESWRFDSNFDIFVS